jgi:hypothetical protein
MNERRKGDEMKDTKSREIHTQLQVFLVIAVWSPAMFVEKSSDFWTFWHGSWTINEREGRDEMKQGWGWKATKGEIKCDETTRSKVPSPRGKIKTRIARQDG